MTPERWAKVDRVWHEVLARPVNQRAATVAELCAGDDTLRRDVESLLAHRADASDAGFLSPEALAAGVAVTPGALIGSRFGQYAIQTLLGAGGMGEVYRAHDTILDRDVAIKIVPDLWLTDPDRRSRFDREARLLAALNHPNIGAIYGIEEHDGIRGLVLELVEGDTLAERLARHRVTNVRRGLPLNEVLTVGVQIADALEAAHERGIVHRDLTPANIKITPEGRVKVLDFGLGKTADDKERESAFAEICPAAAVTATQFGALLGTAAYMSPEQARGESVDKRADIWAFGCVLFEMLTGEPAFTGDTTSQTLSHVIDTNPDFSAVRADLPPLLDRLLRRCLESDRNKRLPHIGIARFEMEQAMAPATAMRTATDVRHHTVRTLTLGVVIGALAALSFVWLRTPRESQTAAPVTRLLVPVTPAEQLGGAEVHVTEGRPTFPAFAISPDGQTLVFSAVRANRRSLYLRRLEAVEAIVIPDTDDAMSPFFSPDGRWVGYWTAGEIRKVPLAGGPSVRVCEASFLFGASWDNHDRIVFAHATGVLWEVPAAGGTPAPLTALNTDRGELSHRLPHVLPGGDAVLFTVIKHRFPRWDQTQIFVYSRRTGNSKLLIDGGADARYASTGHVVYVRDGILLAALLDVERLEIKGGSVGVVSDVMQAAYLRNRSDDIGAAQFEFSATGTLVFLAGGVFRPPDASVVQVDRRGRSEPLPIPPRPFVTLRLSPNGEQIALSTFGRDRDLWMYTPKRNTLNKLIVTGRNSVPIWSRDSERITYAEGVGGPDNLSWIRADGSGSPERLVQREDVLVPAAWMPSGRQLLYYRLSSETTSPPFAATSDAPWIWVHDAAAANSETALPGTLANAGGVDVSPDGRWIAYHSDESGRPQVYVQAYPGPAPRYQVSADGGISPIWRTDGRELFYVRTEAPFPLGTVDAHVMAVPVSLDPTFRFGRPTELFAGPYVMNNPARAYDVSADGQRFLLIQSHERRPGVITDMIVVQNWFSELRRLAPSD
jgi:Tol biopolymer transport system component